MSSSHEVTKREQNNSRYTVVRNQILVSDHWSDFVMKLFLCHSMTMTSRSIVQFYMYILSFILSSYQSFLTVSGVPSRVEEGTGALGLGGNVEGVGGTEASRTLVANPTAI